MNPIIFRKTRKILFIFGDSDEIAIGKEIIKDFELMPWRIREN